MNTRRFLVFSLSSSEGEGWGEEAFYMLPQPGFMKRFWIFRQVVPVQKTLAFGPETNIDEIPRW